MTTVRIPASVAVAACRSHCPSCGRCFRDRPAHDAHVNSDGLYTSCQSPHTDSRLVGVEQGVCEEVPDWRRPTVWTLDPRLPQSIVVPGENGYPVGRRVRRPAA